MTALLSAAALAWTLAAVLPLAVVAGVVWAVLARDASRRARRQKDRLAHKAFMQPRWTDAWSEVDSPATDAQRRDRALTRIGQDIADAPEVAAMLAGLDATHEALR